MKSKFWQSWIDLYNKRLLKTIDWYNRQRILSKRSYWADRQRLWESAWQAMLNEERRLGIISY